MQGFDVCAPLRVLHFRYPKNLDVCGQIVDSIFDIGLSFDFFVMSAARSQFWCVVRPKSPPSLFTLICLGVVPGLGARNFLKMIRNEKHVLGANFLNVNFLTHIDTVIHTDIDISMCIHVLMHHHIVFIMYATVLYIQTLAFLYVYILCIWIHEYVRMHADVHAFKHACKHACTSVAPGVTP